MSTTVAVVGSLWCVFLSVVSVSLHVSTSHIVPCCVWMICFSASASVSHRLPNDLVKPQRACVEKLDQIISDIQISIIWTSQDWRITVIGSGHQGIPPKTNFPSGVLQLCHKFRNLWLGLSWSTCYSCVCWCSGICDNIIIMFTEPFKNGKFF